MTPKVFMEVVEAKTKLASILPFFIGALFAASYFHQFNVVNTVLFFVAMLTFDMATTAINNLMDYYHARDDAYLQNTNVVSRKNLNPRNIALMIIGMISFATILGLVLVWRTDVLLLLVGMLCFGIGIFYTFGPLPLNKLPLGEIFSGVTMGIGIPFLAVYVNVSPEKLLHLWFNWPNVSVVGNLAALIALVLVATMPVCTIANLMLANNLSDYDEDVRNHRTTLPMYVGRKNAVILYQVLAYAGYVAIIIAVIFGALRWPALISLATFPIAMRNTNIFAKKQVKRETFITAVKNLVVENGGLIAGLALSLVGG